MSHQYPRVGGGQSQDDYIRRHDAAEASQTVRFAAAPGRPHTTPLGRTIPAGDELTIDDFVGDPDASPSTLLRAAIMGGEVIERRDSRGEPFPQPTLKVNNSAVIDPPADGWQPHPIGGMSRIVRDNWQAECFRLRDTSTVPYVVAPSASLPLRGGGFLRPGDEVRLEHFRYSQRRGSPARQLQRLVDTGRVIETHAAHALPSGDATSAA